MQRFKAQRLFLRSPPQCATVGLSAHDADAGYGGIRVAVVASRRWSRFWYGVLPQYENIGGETFADGSLVKTSNGVTAGFGVARVAFESVDKVNVGPSD